MATRLTDLERRRIIRLLEAGHTQGHIVRTTGRSHATINAIARSIGHVFDRSATKEATEAKRVDTDARRLELGAQAQAEAFELLRGIRDPSRLHHWDARDGRWVSLELDGPLARDLRDRAVAFAVVVDKAVKLLDIGDAAGDLSDVDRWLKHLRSEAS